MQKLCLVTEPDRPLDAYLSFLQEVTANGVDCVQFRDKKHSFSHLFELASHIRNILKKHNVTFIVNDHVELARAIDADGVHLGQKDMSPMMARKLLGPEKIIGLSIETVEQLDTANQLDCLDYVAASAVFASTTKTDCATLWGLDGLKSFTQKSIHPVVAIGGISVDNVHDVMQQGAAGVAVVSAIHAHANPALAAQELIREINRGLNHV
jgi:thiamine-phosphate pyrophosphorylase